MSAADETRVHRLDGEEALAIRPDRGVLVHARVAHWTLALRAVRAAPASVARAGAVGAPAMQAAPTRAGEERAAEGKAGAPRGARARAIVAHLVLPTAADASSLGAVGPTPPVVAQACVCRATPMPRAARYAVGDLTERPIEAVGAVARAIDAHAVQPAAGRRARTRRAVVATPALFALASAAGTTVAQAPAVAAAAARARELRAVDAAIARRTCARAVLAASATPEAVACARALLAGDTLPAACALARAVDAHAVAGAVGRRRAHALLAAVAIPARVTHARVTRFAHAAPGASRRAHDLATVGTAKASVAMAPLGTGAGIDAHAMAVAIVRAGGHGAPRAVPGRLAQADGRHVGRARQRLRPAERRSVTAGAMAIAAIDCVACPSERLLGGLRAREERADGRGGVDEQGECEDPHPQETVLTTRPVQRDKNEDVDVRAVRYVVLRLTFVQYVLRAAAAQS